MWVMGDHAQICTGKSKYTLELFDYQILWGPGTMNPVVIYTLIWLIWLTLIRWLTSADIHGRLGKQRGRDITLTVRWPSQNPIPD